MFLISTFITVCTPSTLSRSIVKLFNKIGWLILKLSILKYDLLIHLYNLRITVLLLKLGNTIISKLQIILII